MIGVSWAASSAGRALRSQRRGQEFDPPAVHHSSLSAQTKDARRSATLMTATPPDRAGLCGSCRFAQVITSSRGSTFYLCTLAASDPRFRRYPILPVRECAGYERDSSDSTQPT
jgi:hypothetical protein